MALFPCDISHHRYTGKQRSVYFSLLNGVSSESRKMRLCPTHFAEVRSNVVGNLASVEENSQIGMLCAICGEPKIYTLFATMFGEDGYPDAYGADFCAAHGLTALTHIGWDTATRRSMDR